MPQKNNTPPRPTGQAAAWAYDVAAYARALVALRLRPSDAFQQEFWTRRKAELRERWPQHRKVFDQMDAENV